MTNQESILNNKINGVNYKYNSLNTFRLLAALQVLWGHTLAHLELSNIPVLGNFIGFFYGVPIFFTLSGFLIWQSIGSSHCFVDYAKKRFWRIYPELWVAVAVEIIVLLCLYNHSINLPQLGLFTIGQATVFQFWTPDFLRDYGCGCPNGALWTIAVLIQFYFCAYFFHKWFHKKSIYVWLGGAFFCIILGLLTPRITSILPSTIAKLYGVSLIPYLWMFILASFASEYKDRVIPFLKKYWWILIVLLCLNKYVIHKDCIIATYPLFNTIMLFAGLVGFAYAVPQINIKTDISYGVYIYHMTVVNALIALGYVGQSWTLWVVVFITCLLAWISTKTIGSISLKQKQKFA